MQIEGCKHANRNCSIQCPICKLYFVCRFCHNEELSAKIDKNYHDLPYKNVTQIKCNQCGTEQEVS